MTTPYKAKKKSGVVSIAVLLTISTSIIILGAIFGVYAVLNNVSFWVMGSKLPAVVFAAVAMFLGARYFLATMRLWSRIKGQNFSWKNFRKQVKAKPQKCKAF